MFEDMLAMKEIIGLAKSDFLLLHFSFIGHTIQVCFPPLHFQLWHSNVHKQLMLYVCFVAFKVNFAMKLVNSSSSAQWLEHKSRQLLYRKDSYKV